VKQGRKGDWETGRNMKDEGARGRERRAESRALRTGL